ncbi:protein kinase [Fragilaria crotonensis]|nr:protein kinase [Fragilaria crotonensis]
MTSRLKPIHAIVLLPVLIFLRYCRLQSLKGVQPHPLRPRSDAQVNTLPILISSLDRPHALDFGGWLSPIPFHQKEKFPHNNYVLADFGSLHMRTLNVEHFVREIDPKDDEKYENLRVRELNRMDLYPTSAKYDQDDEADYTECRPPNWKKLYFPTCNSFHEIDISRGYDRSIISNVEKNYDSYVFSQGFYRDAWLVENVERKEATVLKTLRFKHDYTPKSFSNVQRDAIVMERLSFSPKDCAWRGYMKQEDLDDSDDVRPQNDYTPLEKLEFGLAMAESLAVLHSYVGGLIVHDDVQLCQWLRTRDGRLVLGDFNRAQIMDWNEKKGEYCLYNNGYAFGNYRSPEEFAGRDLNEKIDIFSFGNNMYSLMTGLWPFYENEDDGFVQKEIVNGKTGFIDKRYRSRSYAEGKWSI